MTLIKSKKYSMHKLCFSLIATVFGSSSVYGLNLTENDHNHNQGLELTDSSHDKGALKVRLNPFRTKTPNSDFNERLKETPLNALDLVGASVSELKQVESYLKAMGLPQSQELHWKIVKQPFPKNISEYHFLNDQQIPLCEFYVRYKVLKNNEPYLGGLIPSFEPSLAKGISLEQFPTLDSVQQNLHNHIGQELALSKITACLYYADGNLHPSYTAFASTTQGSSEYWQIIADANSVWKMESLNFHATSEISYYKQNKNSDILKDTFELTSSEYLENKYFSTDPGSSTRATAVDGNFLFGPDQDAELAETTSFVHATRMMSWFLEHGFSFEEPKIIIKLHQTISNSINNGRYLPVTSSRDNPLIELGDGDGNFLQHLPYDSDVVSHELGHHLVYQYLKDTGQNDDDADTPRDEVNQSLALHEGLADFFVFAKTGDACLGESICPGTEDNPICYMKGKCLRAGTTGVKYASDEYYDFASKPHLKGQVVSGLLWNLRNDSDISEDTFDEIAVKSIEFLERRSTYVEFVNALLLADIELNNGDYECDILENAENDGFEYEVSQLSDGTCNALRVAPDPGSSLVNQRKGGGGNSQTAGNTKSSGSKGGLFGCGVISTKIPQSKQSMPLLVLLLLLGAIPPLAHSLRHKIK